MIDPDAKAVVAPELMPGERLLWAGRPQRLPLNALGLMGTVMAGLFVVIGLFVILGALLADGGAFVVVFGCVWTVISGWNLYSFSRMLRGPASQSYALTDRRGIIVETMGRGRWATLGPQDLCSFERSGGSDIGTLSFNDPGIMGMTFQFKPTLPLKSFRNIANPAQVERLIHQTFSGATP